MSRQGYQLTLNGWFIKDDAHYQIVWISKFCLQLQFLVPFLQRFGDIIECTIDNVNLAFACCVARHNSMPHYSVISLWRIIIKFEWNKLFNLFHQNQNFSITTGPTMFHYYLILQDVENGCGLIETSMQFHVWTFYFLFRLFLNEVENKEVNSPTSGWCRTGHSPTIQCRV